MKRTPLDFRRVALSLATKFALATMIVLPYQANADEPSAGVILLAGTSNDAEKRSAEKKEHTKAVQAPTPAVSVSPPAQPPVWVPRVRRGAPASRIGGATRSRNKAVTIRTLVPEVDEAALTLAAQPQLYWHLSPRTTHPVNFTLLDPDATDPIVDTIIEGPFEAGIHVLSLADYGAQLEPGRNYEWFVAVVPDPNNRSADSVARGVIIRVADPELASQVASSEPDATTGLLAQSGIWYEALDVASRCMQEKPEDPRLRQQRDAMLQQVGLVLSGDR
jgi:hypothetical protein